MICIMVYLFLQNDIWRVLILTGDTSGFQVIYMNSLKLLIEVSICLLWITLHEIINWNFKMATKYSVLSGIIRRNDLHFVQYCAPRKIIYLAHFLAICLILLTCPAASKVGAETEARYEPSSWWIQSWRPQSADSCRGHFRWIWRWNLCANFVKIEGIIKLLIFLTWILSVLFHLICRVPGQGRSTWVADQLFFKQTQEEVR